MIAVRHWVGAMALLLAGCSLGDTVLPPQTDAVAGPAPPYRKLIAGGLAGILGDPKRVSTLQISDLRRVDSLAGPAWLACLRATLTGAAAGTKPGTSATPSTGTPASTGPLDFAVFLQQEKILESRLAIRADRCEDQAFAPFNAAKP